jgi:hypothetical protein
MADEPDFIERAEGISKNWTGEAYSDDRVVQEFHLYGHAKRAHALDALDAELSNVDGDLSAGTSAANRLVRLNTLRNRMDQVHHALRKAGR